jgi:hypothetical protein
METVADLLTLTDDEAIALATLFPGQWRAPLPTVDVTNREKLAGAVYRGRRSLVVRDLAGPDATPTGAAAEVAKRIATGLRAFILFADEADSWVPDGITMYLYGPALDAIEVSQTVGAAGVHYFRLAPPAGQWRALVMLAEGVYADGFTGPSAQGEKTRPAAVLLYVVRPDGLRSVRVAHVTVTTGRGPVPARFLSVADAVAWLLA